MTENLRIRDDGMIVLRNVVLSYEHCHEPWAKNANEKPAYSGTFILPNKTHEAARKKIRELILEIEKTEHKKRLPADKICLRDGNNTNKPEYEDAWILVAREREDHPPVLLDRDGRTRVTKKDDKIYSGAVVNVMFRLWAQKNDWGSRVNANLVGVQFMAHGEKFSGIERPSEDEMFEDEGAGDDFDSDGFGD